VVILPGAKVRITRMARRSVRHREGRCGRGPASVTDDGALRRSRDHDWFTRQTRQESFMNATEPRSLAGGMVLRPATAADLLQAAALLAERGEPADAVDVELVAASQGLDAVGVVVDGDEVVATATLLDETVHLAGTAIPTGQVELVATHRDHEGRGLASALMGWAHERSRARGHLLQVMIGIPYFYRRFGYEYVQPIPTWHPLTERPGPVPDVTVRRATTADLPELQRLQDCAQADADLRMPHSPACWSWLLVHDASELWVAERDGRPVGMVRTLPPTQSPAAAELATNDDQAALTLLDHAAGRCDEPLLVHRRPGLPDPVTAHLAGPEDEAEWYYARVADVPTLLTHLAPVLQQRLLDVGLELDQELLLSTYRRHWRLRIDATGVAVLGDGGAEQAPVSKGGSGVPPDAIAQLLVGTHGAIGLEQRLPDCLLGRQRELMSVLFPPLTADLLTFYLPT
jgi:predicted N-acetyltransferase YhbS